MWHTYSSNVRLGMQPKVSTQSREVVTLLVVHYSRVTHLLNYMVSRVASWARNLTASLANGRERCGSQVGQPAHPWAREGATMLAMARHPGITRPSAKLVA